MNRHTLAIALAFLLVPGLVRDSTATAAQLKVVEIPIPSSGIVTERIEVSFDLGEDHLPIQEIRLRAQGDFTGEFVYECTAIFSQFTVESGSVGVSIYGAVDQLTH